MSKIRQRYDEEFRKNAVKLSYATTKTIKEFCEDLGIHPSLLYRWRKIYTENGDKTKVAEQQDKLRQMQLELAELKMENEMLKKAAAYVCHDADAQEQGTACCTRDEGGPLGIAVQAEISNHLKVLSGQPVVLSVKEKAGKDLSDECMEDERK